MLLQKPTGITFKILSLVATLLILLGTISLASFLSCGRIKEGASMMHNRHVVPLMSALGLKLLVVQNSHLVRHALVQNAPGELSRTVRRIEENRKKVEELSDICASSCLADTKNGRAGEWKKLFREINEKQDEIIALARIRLDKDEAIMRLSADGDISVLENDYLNAVDGFTMNLARVANRDIVHLTRLANWETFNVTVVLAAAFFTGALFVFIVLQHITAPLRGLQTAVANFSNSDFESEIHVRGGGEIAAMTVSLKDTSRNLHELVATAKKTSREITGVASELEVLAHTGGVSAQALLETADSMKKSLGDVMTAGMKVGGLLENQGKRRGGEPDAIGAIRRMLRRAAEASKTGGRVSASASEMTAMAIYLARAADTLALLSEDLEAKLDLLAAPEQPKESAELANGKNHRGPLA